MYKLLKYKRIILKKPRVILHSLKAVWLIKILKKKALRGVELAVTYACQAHCEKCSALGLKEKREEMSIGQITNICKAAVNNGAILINLTGGEPLLRSDIFEIVNDLRRLPAIISLTSNGLKLDEGVLDKLKENGLNLIQVSLSSPIECEHDKQIGFTGSYNRVMDAIAYARKIGIEVFINTVITKEILRSERMSQLLSIASKLDCFLSLILPASVGGWKGKDVNLTPEDHSQLSGFLKLSFVTIDTDSCLKSGGCPAGSEKIYISPYGDLYPCPFIHINNGNILKDDFGKLWEKMANLSDNKCINIK